MKKHIMFDLESLSTKGNAVVMSIGACEFFPSEEGEDFLGDSIYIVLDTQPQIDAGLDIKGETVKWWLTQEANARQAIVKEKGVDPQQGLSDFVRWCQKVGCDNIWSHVSFDQPIVDNLLDTFNIGKPWKYNSPRDIRTLQMLCPDVGWCRTGDHHNALDDAITQARWVSKALQSRGDQV